MSRKLAVALSLLLAPCAFGQPPQKPAEATDKEPSSEVIVKEIRPDGGKVLDASGLTNNFERMHEMLRSTARLDLDGVELQIHTGRLPPMGIDYQAFEALDQGVVQFQAVAAIKLRTPKDLRFGELAVPMGNAAPDYPGLYSLWLKRSESGDWSLVFNEEADAWGSMYEPEANVGEVSLSHSVEENVKLPLGVSIEDGDQGKVLQFAWGEHRWSTPFSIAQ